MNKFFAAASLVALSISSFAMASDLPTGSYSCQKSDTDQRDAGTFYVRKDGTSAHIQVISAHHHDIGNGIPGCFKVSFKWADSGKAVSDAFCCPTGSN